MIPKPRSADAAIFASAFVLIVGFLLINTPPAWYYLLDPDQGYQLAVADQILRGFHPFVDVLGSNYGPLVFYLSAFGQLVSDGRLIGEIALVISGYAAGYFLLFGITLQSTKSRWLSFSLLAFALLLMPRFYKYYVVLGPAVYATALFFRGCPGRC